MSKIRMIHTDYLAAGSPRATIETLQHLAVSEVPAVRRRVAENARTPIKILTEMAMDDDPQVRIAVGLNTETPSAVLSQLIYDDDPDVRFWLASTSYLPKRLIIELTEDPNPYVSRRALRTALLVQAGLPQPRLSIFDFLGQDHSLLVARLEKLIDHYSCSSHTPLFDEIIDACDCVKRHFERQHKLCLDRISDTDYLSRDLLTKIAADHKHIDEKIDALIMSHSDGANRKHVCCDLRELLELVVYHIEFAEMELFDALRQQVALEKINEMSTRASQALLTKAI